MIKVRTMLATFVAAWTLLVLTHSSFAQTVPWFASGTDAVYNPDTGDYAMQGIGLHLGAHTIVGNVEPAGVFFPTPDIFFCGTFTGSQTVTAADGSTIEMDLSGSVLLFFDTETGLASGTWFPEFVITDGEGRFDGASGTLSGEAFNPPFDPFTSPLWMFDWFIEGEVNLNKNNK